MHRSRRPPANGSGCAQGRLEAVRCLAVVGLEFELAAEIIQTVISPEWMDIAQLGAIAVISTPPCARLERLCA
jgi:uncharacterized membrane protein